MMSPRTSTLGVGLALGTHAIALVDVTADVLLAGTAAVAQAGALAPDHGLALVVAEVHLAAPVDPAVARGAVAAFGAEVVFVPDLTHLGLAVVSGSGFWLDVGG